MANYQLDRANFGLDFDSFWNVIGKTLRAEFVEEAVISPLVILCGELPEDADLSPDDLTDIFDNVLIEEDVLPLLQMAMSLGLASPVESLDPDMFNVARRRGSVLSGELILLTSFSTLTAGKLVTKKESMKEPMSACLRRRKSSLVPRSQRRGSRDEVGEAGGGGGSRTGSPGNITPRSGNISRRGSVDPTSEAMEALRQFQLKSSKSYKSVSKPATENLGLALKMIKKRRSLFEHGKRLENRGTSAINI